MRHHTSFIVVIGTVTMVGLAITPPVYTYPDDLPPMVQVTGVVRDFREWGIEGGHPDFEQMPDNGFGRYADNIANSLNAQSNPVFTGGGAKIAQQWRDAEHRAICHCLYDPALGDMEGQFSQPGTGGITSAETFAQWFDDATGVNLSQSLTLDLLLQPDGTYVFDSETDSPYAEVGGFFPIDGQLFGNSEGSEHNFHFTFELHAQFEYHAGDEPFFKFEGDDTIFVFINNQLVIDLAAVHAAHDQYLDVTRLGLEEGQTYPIDFYFAQRHKPQSNFKISTNLFLQASEGTSISGVFD